MGYEQARPLNRPGLMEAPHCEVRMWIMTRRMRYSREVRERAVALVCEQAIAGVPPRCDRRVA